MKTDIIWHSTTEIWSLIPARKAFRWLILFQRGTAVGVASLARYKGDGFSVLYFQVNEHSEPVPFSESSLDQWALVES